MAATPPKHPIPGSNYARLLRIQREYDPAGLFYVRPGVGSEDWSDDGFRQLAER